VVGLQRSTYYKIKRRQPTQAEIRRVLLADAIADIHARSRGTYGMLRVRAALEIEQGLIVNKNLVWKIMRQLGIRGLPGPKKGKPNPVNAAVVDAVLGIADETGSTAVQVSLAWLRHRDSLAPTALVPIVGPRSLVHLEHYLRSLECELDERHYRHLDEVSAVRMGTPHEDVAAALSHGFDGDRTSLEALPVPVI
jgi:hypothetical protein